MPAVGNPSVLRRRQELIRNRRAPVDPADDRRVG